MSNLLIEAKQLSKTYHDAHHTVDVLHALDLSIHAGERIAIVGSSGSGKSTLLHLLGGLDKPTSGAVHIRGKDWQSFSETARCQLRNQALGFVYQFHHLLREFTALENVAMPLLIARCPVHEALKKAKQCLDDVELSHRYEHKPAELSGGERQRVAIARALVTEPACLLADEPTGNLDYVTAHHVFDMMLSLNQTKGVALMVVTHDHQLAARMDCVMTLKAGVLTQEKKDA